MRLAVCGMIVLLSGANAQDRERGLWNSEFRQQRAPAAGRDPAARPGIMLGVTAWRLRESRQGDRVRALVHESSGTINYTPERLGADTQLAEGDKVRISIEPGVPGFLYVISREVYADGTHGEPVLLFPTGRIRGGKNEIYPGEQAEIPEWNNPTPYFTLRRGKANETGEQVFVLLSPHALPEVRVASDTQPLSPSLLNQWIRQWGGKVRMLDAPASKGAPLTPAERQAADQSARLTNTDPVPQVLFRASTPGQATLLAEYILRLRP